MKLGTGSTFSLWRAKVRILLQSTFNAHNDPNLSWELHSNRMINAEVIQLTMLRAKEKTRDASALCIYQQIWIFSERLHSKSTGSPPKLTEFYIIRLAKPRYRKTVKFNVSGSYRLRNLRIRRTDKWTWHTTHIFVVQT